MFEVSGLVDSYVMLLRAALPIAAVFGFTNLAVDTILTAAFGGGLKLGGGRR